MSKKLNRTELCGQRTGMVLRGQDHKDLQGVHDANIHFTQGFAQFASLNVHHLKLVYH